MRHGFPAIKFFHARRDDEAFCDDVARAISPCHKEAPPLTTRYTPRPLLYLGQSYALMTAVCWAGSAVCFESAGRRVGSLAVNLWRMVIASVLLAAMNWLWLGHVGPVGAPPRAWLLLAASGAIGFFIGDLALFRAFLLIGARRSTLIMSLAPAFAATLGFAVLDEQLSGFGLVGMAVTLAGVFWVISERTARPSDLTPHSVRETRLGVLLAFIGAVGQAVGLILVKLAERSAGDVSLPPIAETLVRALAGTVCFAVFIAAVGHGPAVLRATRNGRAMSATSLGALIGPVLGVTLLLASMHESTPGRLSPGIAQTFAATVPVLMLPVAAWQGRERVTWRATLGALLTVAGVVVLCTA